MSPLCGLGLFSYIVFLVVLHVTCALKLQTPHQHDHVTIGVPFHVSWTSESGPNDPSTLNITLSCNSNTTILDGSVPILSKSADVNIQSWEIQNSSFPLSCNLQAIATNSTVLDGVTIEVTNSTTPTSASSVLSPTSTPSSEAKLSSSSMSSNKSNSDSASSSTKTSLSSMNMTISSSSSSSSAQPSTRTTTSQITPSSSSCPSSCATQNMTSLSTSSTGSVKPLASSLTQAAPKRTGTIIGGVVGGLIGLLVLAILLFFCWRRSRRRHLSHFPSLMPDVKSNLSSVAVSTNKEALLTAERGTPSALNVSAAGSQHNHSGSSSLGHDFLARRQSPDNTHAQMHSTRLPESFNTILVSVPPATPTAEEDWEPQHTYHRPSSSTSSRSSTTEESGPSDETRQPQSSSPCSVIYKEINQSSTDALDVESMDPEEREQRRDALLQKMRRVLDGEQSV